MKACIPTVSERIADYCQLFVPSMLSEEDIATVSRSLLDTLAVGVGGRREPVAQIALNYARSLGGAGLSRIWGSNSAISIEGAAFYNGVSAHALDYDDVTPVLRGHASVVLWPALIALAESRESSSERLFAAFAVGFEVICRLSKVLANDMYQQGWHTTSALGVVGATVACAYLIELTDREIVSAIGLAVSQASGNQQSFGTMAKPFQVGSAAVTALRAVELARMGFSGPADSIDGLVGFSSLYASGQSVSAAFESLGCEHSLALSTYGFDIKKYPACYATHRAIDGILSLRATHNMQWSDVDRISVRVSANGLQPLISDYPMTGLHAKFSMKYAVATALEKGAPALADYTDDWVAREGISKLMDRIDVAEDHGEPESRYARIEAHLKSGAVVNQYVQSLTGEHAKPLDTAALATKLADCLAWGASSASATAVIAAVMTMPQCSLSLVLDRLAA